MSKKDENDKQFFDKPNTTFKPSARGGVASTGSVSNTNLKVSTVAREKYKEKRRKKVKRRRTILNIIGGILKFILITMIVVLLAGVGAVAGLYLSVQNGAGALSKTDFEINNFTTYIYDINGKEYTQLTGAENRTYASLDEISPHLPDAFIAIEDERFMQHKGVDIKRTAGATIKYLLSKVGIGKSEFGGSTITQQVIKKVTGEDDHSSLRKAKEIIRAFQLEKWLSKSDIIELYMNLIYLGEGAYGVETASYTYFGKSAKDLSIAQCAIIAGLAQAPEGYNPYNYPEKAKKRQELVLGKMYELGKISEEEYKEALEEELVYQKGSLNLASSNSYFIDAVVEECIKDLMEEKGINRQMAQKMVYNNGLHIYTTLDPKVQSVLEDVYKNEKYFHTRQGYDEKLQSAMVIIDYKEGNVVGLIGGAGEKTTLRGLNRATGMTRSIGSNMKPIGVYGPGLEKGTITAATTFDDVPTTYNIGGRAWSIKNYDRTYRGLINIRKAIEISDNVVAAKCMMEAVDTEYSYSFLEKLGISTLTSKDKSSPAALSLGGMTKGISPLELAAAYGTIANNGVYVEPKLYTRIEDRNNQVILNKVGKGKVRDVMSIENAYILTDMMHTVVVGSQGTGAKAKLPGIDVAAKTGTTSDDKDRWFTAFTPYYVGAVWFGYDTPQYINVPSNPGTTVWHDVMAAIHKDLPNATFTRPAGVINVDVCRDSGLLATEACKADKRGSRVSSQIFNSKNGSIPKTYCTVHEFVDVCPDTFDKPNPACLQEVGTIKISRLNRHYKEGQPSYKPADYAYEVSNKYCTFHYCPQDAYGNYLTPTASSRNAEQEIKSINNNVTDRTDITKPIEEPGIQSATPPTTSSTTNNTTSNSTSSMNSSSNNTSSNSTSTNTNSNTSDSDGDGTGRRSQYWWER